MKTFGKKAWALLGLALIVVITSSLCLPEFRYRHAVRKYRFGMTAEALERENGIRMELRKNGNYLADDANDLTKRRHFSYDARVPRDFVELDFNDFHELIAITKTTPLARLGFYRERSLHSMYQAPVR